jgi:hypothetical protein
MLFDYGECVESQFLERAGSPQRAWTANGKQGESRNLSQTTLRFLSNRRFSSIFAGNLRGVNVGPVAGGSNRPHPKDQCAQSEEMRAWRAQRCGTRKEICRTTVPSRPALSIGI